MAPAEILRILSVDVPSSHEDLDAWLADTSPKSRCNNAAGLDAATKTMARLGEHQASTDVRRPRFDRIRVSRSAAASHRITRRVWPSQRHHGIVGQPVTLLKSGEEERANGFSYPGLCTVLIFRKMFVCISFRLKKWSSMGYKPMLACVHSGAPVKDGKL
ncbi:hypothetical protein TRIUR3_07328 [Triticum urartu]|uniref:Uncharacterized protein n=1 Tax=Triticum urartu TaxID=4572 RepID=M7YQG7_TRIUA|nr:hypothetical protein TRIUR3_07328 [Triticum urartu]